MTKLGLTLNEAKTSLRDARKERFDFLGYSFGPHIWRKNGQRYLGASPSKKSIQRLKTKVGELIGRRKALEYLLRSGRRVSPPATDTCAKRHSRRV